MSTEQIRARVLYDKWRKPGNSWAIVNMRQLDQNGKIIQDFIAVGDVPHSGIEEPLDMVGEWVTDPHHGRQFKVSYATRVRPVTASGLESYLGAMVDGVGPVTAKKMIDHFGFARLQSILDHEPQRLTEIKGISVQGAKRITTSWKSNNDPLTKEVGMFLAKHGISTKWTQKIIKAFGSRTIDVLTQNPYKLARVKGVGFITADAMAKQLGKPAKSPDRTEACFLHCLFEALKDGHVCLPDGLIIEQVEKLAGVTRDEVIEALNKVVERGELTKQTAKDEYNEYTYLYLPKLYEAEVGLARRITELNSYDHSAPDRLVSVTNSVQERMNRTFSAKQKEAITNAFSHHVNIVTGGPGTGKTTIVEAIVNISERLKLRCALGAPTGRAARRLTEVAGEQAFTIHRLLGYSHEEKEWAYNRENPIDADICIIDEASMLDVELSYRLLDAIPDKCSVVFVGDVDQLPSVGPGQVLGDLIRSKKVQVTILDTIFRQAEDSLIVRNSHKIRRGETPSFPPGDKEVDSFFIAIPRGQLETKTKVADDVEWAKEKLARLVTVNLPEKFPKLSMIKDVQVLAPMRKGTLGVPELNTVLQEALNPNGLQFTIAGKAFRIGDRVMQTKNDYNLDVSNGDIGFIRNVDMELKTVSIDFYDRRVEYLFQDTSNLELAYAQTIHKSQGSEFPVVIIVMAWQHSIMLQRNLLYTANTRAKKMALYLSSKGAVEKATKTCETKDRYTFLVWRLTKEKHGQQTANRV